MKNKRDEYLGKVFTSCEGVEYVIIEYTSCYDLVIKALDGSGYTTSVGTKHVLSRQIKNPLFKSVASVGFLGEGSYIGSYINSEGRRVKYKYYGIWKNMLQRCYVESNKRFSSYGGRGVYVCDEWLNFQNFAEWYCDYPIKGDDWHLDKDILTKGNKVYSPETCCIIPQEINQTFVLRRDYRGDFPVGVYFDKSKNKFATRLSVNGVHTTLGVFSTATEAFLVYKQAKENTIKSIADKWKTELPHAVYNALYAYEVSIDD